MAALIEDKLDWTMFVAGLGRSLMGTGLFDIGWRGLMRATAGATARWHCRYVRTRRTFMAFNFGGATTWSGSMARVLPRRLRVYVNLRRLPAYRDPTLRLGRPVLDADTNRESPLSRSAIELAARKREEAPRVLKALIVAAQRTIEKSRALIAKVDEILAKQR
jgi:hypothetical protein